MVEETKAVELEEEEIPSIKLKFKINLDDVYEYLKSDATNHGQGKEKVARARLYFQLVLCALFSAGILFIPGIEKTLAIVPIFAMILFYLVYRSDLGTIRKSDKMLDKLLAKAKKGDGEDFTEGQNIKFYENKILCLWEGFNRHVHYDYIAGTYYTENLFIIRIFAGRKIPCSDVERIIIPKRIMSEANLKQIEDFVQSKIAARDIETEIENNK